MDAETARLARAYEDAVMARKPGEPEPDVEPPEGYEMSPRFQQWLVGQMQREVFGEEGGMAIIDTRALAKRAEEE